MEKIENEVNLYLFTSLSHQSLSKQKQIMITNEYRITNDYITTRCIANIYITVCLFN